MTENEIISVIVPSYNTAENHLQKLYNSLLNQSYQNFEVIIVDDCSDYDYYNEVIDDERVKVIYKDYNSGPADTRNTGVDKAGSNYLFFTDADCEMNRDTLKTAVNNLKKDDIIMGNTVTRTETYFGKAVAYLGFPGGGILGFDNVWRVAEDGYTDSISSCNLAINRKIFNSIGRFNTSFPVPGGEDTAFAKTAVKKGYKIKYCPGQLIYHVERGSLRSFIRWQITRGKGNYYIKKNVDNIKGFFKLRLWSIKNSLLAAGFKYFFIVALLWGIAVLLQTAGYYLEKVNSERSYRYFQ